MTPYVKAFKLLSGRRQVGMAANPLMISEMIAVATDVYLVDDIEDFIRVISYMDDGFLMASAAKSEAKSRKNSK